jgi:hypothetical protein
MGVQSHRLRLLDIHLRALGSLVRATPHWFGLDFASLAACVDVDFSTVRSRNRFRARAGTASVAHLARVKAGLSTDNSVAAV